MRYSLLMTLARRRAFVEDGVVILPKLVPQELCRAAEEAIEATETENGRGFGAGTGAVPWLAAVRHPTPPELLDIYMGQPDAVTLGLEWACGRHCDPSGATQGRSRPRSSNHELLLPRRRGVEQPDRAGRWQLHRAARVPHRQCRFLCAAGGSGRSPRPRWPGLAAGTLAPRTRQQRFAGPRPGAPGTHDPPSHPSHGRLAAVRRHPGEWRLVAVGHAAAAACGRCSAGALPSLPR